MSRKKQDRQEAPGSVFVDQAARVTFASMRTPSTAGGGANGERYTDWPAATFFATGTGMPAIFTLRTRDLCACRSTLFSISS